MDAADDSVPHDMGEWAGLVTPRVAGGGFFIFPYRGEGVFGWLERAPWHGAVKNVRAAWPHVPAAGPIAGFGRRACLRGAGKRTDWQPPTPQGARARCGTEMCLRLEKTTPRLEKR